VLRVLMCECCGSVAVGLVSAPICAFRFDRACHCTFISGAQQLLCFVLGSPQEFVLTLRIEKEKEQATKFLYQVRSDCTNPDCPRVSRLFCPKILWLDVRAAFSQMLPSTVAVQLRDGTTGKQATSPNTLPNLPAALCC
jgi:hypothetical protein